MTITRIISQENILVLDGTDLPAGVGPDLSAAHIECQNEETNGNLAPQVESLDVGVQGPDHREQDHDQLQQSHGHDHEMYGGGVDLLVYLTSVISVNNPTPAKPAGLWEHN